VTECGSLTVSNFLNFKLISSNFTTMVMTVSAAKTAEPIEMFEGGGRFVWFKTTCRIGRIGANWRIQWIHLCGAGNAGCRYHFCSNLFISPSCSSVFFLSGFFSCLDLKCYSDNTSCAKKSLSTLLSAICSPVKSLKMIFRFYTLSLYA